MSGRLLKNIFRPTPVLPIIRVDDRLIHSQVVVGWGEKLGLRRIILASDRVFKDDMLTELYCSLIPPEIAGIVLRTDYVENYLRTKPLGGRQMIVVEFPDDAMKLLEFGVKTSKVVIGGLHFIEGSQRLLSYLFIDDDRKKSLSRLLDSGLPVVCQDLPSNSQIRLSEKLLNI